ncbi:MAG: hypothetical protein A2Y98_02195 [Candidatus Portnoybacteria bacterium RBG_19FT_COMBO_36_7]|uniref:DUF5667 domain-containing protein n=1 Tax=Candidatus Portnoybacteria bacterium RBG_19FT_COMBO_36_7 TaxID=1801992 RepID=A0A1G2F8P4_9BACT|nr:MAG: hypothetical protein A2Y98_02195 [Candidatus Portnoybacteria bacterium RBG_19FT_COMBO_36_7]
MSEISENNLIERLNQLKKIKPDENWVIFCREKITLEMAKNSKKETIPAFNFSSAIVSIWCYIRNPHPVLKPVAAFVLIFGFMFSSSLAVIAGAKNSLPGDRLFPVKIALEEARLFATTSAEGKAQVQTDMISARIDELNKIISTEGSMEQKQTKIEEAVNNLQRHLLSAKDELPKLSKTEAKKVVAAARKIDESAASAEQSLSQAKLALSPDMKNNLTDKIAEATEEADKTSIRALEMMVQMQGEGGMSETEIAAKVDDKIQKTRQIANILSETVSNSAISDKLPINATIILDESDKAIEQALECLRNGDFAGALTIIKTATEMVKSAQQMVDAASLPETQDPVQNPVIENATTSPATTPFATSTPSAIIDIEIDFVHETTTPPVWLNISVFGTSVNNE